MAPLIQTAQSCDDWLGNFTDRGAGNIVWRFGFGRRKLVVENDTEK